MESEGEPDRGQRCREGCGLVRLKKEHSCVEALRAFADGLEERAASLEHEARMAELRWNRREQFLLSQVSTLQNETQIAALRYQRRLHQYLLHTSSIAAQIVGFCQVRVQTRFMACVSRLITVKDENSTLFFFLIPLFKKRKAPHSMQSKKKESYEEHLRVR